MPKIRKLIVNADDFGLSDAINSGILQAHLHGIVTSTSMVASGEAFRHAIQIATQHPSLGLGVHLTLVEENAVAAPSQLTHLAPHGVLPGSYGKLMKSLVTAHIPLGEIEREFRAQIERCLAAGLSLTHLDSHQHTHAFPAIFRLVLRLAHGYRVPCVRIPRGWPSRQNLRANRFPAKCVLSMLATFDAVAFPLAGLHTTDHFAGLFESGDLNETQLGRILGNLEEGTTELVCHPGCPDPNPRYASWNQRRQVELAALTSDSTRRLIEQRNIRLINYAQLPNRPANTAA